MQMFKRQPRARKASRRLDLSSMKEALRDRRCWTCMGLVVVGEDGNHFEIDENADVLVEVQVQPSQDRLTCRLGSVAGGPGRGVWSIPPVGTEVAVIVPDGQLDFMPIIVATLSTGEVPPDLDETTIVMANNLGDIAIIPSGDVKLGSASATEQALRGNSFQSKFNSFVNAYKVHTHISAAPTVPTAIPDNAGTVSGSDASDLSDKVKVS